MDRSSGSEPKIRLDRNVILVSPLSSGPLREVLVIMNEGKGRLYGSIRSDADWVKVLDTALNTTFIQRVTFEIRPDKAPASGESWVHILSTGGIGRVKIELRRIPAPISSLQINEKHFQFCGITRDENISFSFTVRNSGTGFLSGTAVPLCDWIVIPARGIWTRTVQVIQVRVITSKAPLALHPVGRIHVRTNGGEETVEVSIHRSQEKRSVPLFIPSSLRISWSVPGIIEERLIVKNTGKGALRGTIPSKYPWITVIPSIFSVTDSTVLTIRVDTRLLPGTAPASVTLGVITNVGPFTLNIEIIRSYQAQLKPRIHLPRIKVRSRMTVLDLNGGQLQITSSGKSGGEGEIWFVEGDDSRCVKIFHPHRSSPEMEEKIQIMQKSPIKISSGTGICWPSGIIVSNTAPSRFLGYMMTRLDNRFMPVHAWYDNPDQDFSLSMQAAARLAGLVQAVHSSGHCVGDLRENNIFISTTGEICLIDTDSFQITDPSSSKTWFCRVGTGEYLPPELIDSSFEKQNIDRLFSDRFALAVLIFRFLMQGAHPYQGRGPLIEDAPTTSDKILRGLFAYEGKIPGLFPPDYAPSYDRIPSSVRALFHEAFVTGHQHPQARPEPFRWEKVLGLRYGTVTGIAKSGLFICNKMTGSESDPEPKKDIIPEYIDDDGNPVHAGNRFVRITHGEIRRTDRPGFAFLTVAQGLTPLVSCQVRKIPASIIIPKKMVYQNQNHEKKIHYLIPEIDFSMYVHWHQAADPESRRRWKNGSFSFRHRVAACRNLLSALLSMARARLYPLSLSPRSVFTAPDSSVRIIAVSHDQLRTDEEVTLTLLSEVRTLLYMMMMDGCNPNQVSDRLLRSRPGYVPSPDRIPFPMRHIFSEIPDITRPIEEIISRWFTRSDDAFISLISCQTDPDHWFSFFPGICPFCHPDHFSYLLQGPTHVRLYLPISVLFLLSAPVHTVRHLKRRRIQMERVTIPVIFLPFCNKRLLQIPGRYIHALAARNSNNVFLPVCHKRLLPACIPRMTVALVIIPKVFSLEAMILKKFDVSLIDEMRWVSSLEQMKGNFFPRLVRMKRVRRCYVRKTISIMLLPGYFEIPKKPVTSKENKGKKGKPKGNLSKKLSDFIEDFFG